jgi:predicted enzyme related to lactoylglutathione lyase
MYGDLVYIELPINLDRLEDTFHFYQTLFDWKIQESFISKQRYFVFQTPGKKLFGGFDSSLKPSVDSINIYIYVESIDQTFNLIKTYFPQTKILRSKTLISPEDGSYALIIDPSGNKIGINEYIKP